MLLKKEYTTAKYSLVVLSDSASDMQPVVETLECDLVETVTGIDTDTVEVSLCAGADASAYEAMLESDDGVLSWTRIPMYEVLYEVLTSDCADSANTLADAMVIAERYFASRGETMHAGAVFTSEDGVVCREFWSSQREADMEQGSIAPVMITGGAR